MNLSRNKWVLIQRYVTGNAKPDEYRELNNWMALDSERRKLVREIQEIWDLTPEEDFEVKVQEAWEKFQARNASSITTIGDQHYSHRPSGAMVHLFRAAAFILAALIAGYFFQYITASSETDLLSERSEFYTMQVMETDRGEKSRVTFSDGTQVTLNSASSIHFPQEFHGSTRKVYLDGEAYFKVAHHSDQPFVVHAPEAEVEVLGTEFNVRGWSEDHSVEVAVREGKVSVRSADQLLDDQAQIILTEGFYTIVKKGQGPAPAQRVDVINHLLWASGGMHFDSVPFERVVRDLERRFNVEITVIDDELMEVPYTGTFQYAELDEVLSVIAATMSIGYSREGVSIEFGHEQ